MSHKTAHVILSTFLFFTSLPATAQEISPANNNMQNSAGSSANIYTTAESADLSKSVPNVFMPGLSNVPETCAISGSAGVGFSGFGIGVGSSKANKDCNLRMNAKLIAQFGDLNVARLIMCNNKEVRLAYRAAGTPCLDEKPTNVQKEQKENE